MVASYIFWLPGGLGERTGREMGWKERGGGGEDGLNRDLGQRTVGRWGGRRGERKREGEWRLDRIWKPPRKGCIQSLIIDRRVKL